MCAAPIARANEQISVFPSIAPIRHTKLSFFFRVSSRSSPVVAFFRIASVSFTFFLANSGKQCLKKLFHRLHGLFYRNVTCPDEDQETSIPAIQMLVYLKLKTF